MSEVLYLYFGGTMLATVIAAIALCRYRVAHKKRISYGTLLASSVVANVSVFLGMGIYEEGWHIFTREAWTGGKGGLAGTLFVLAVLTIFCLLPALVVAVCYEWRSKRNEKRAVKQNSSATCHNADE